MEPIGRNVSRFQLHLYLHPKAEIFRKKRKRVNQGFRKKRLGELSQITFALRGG